MKEKDAEVTGNVSSDRALVEVWPLPWVLYQLSEFVWMYSMCPASGFSSLSHALLWHYLGESDLYLGEVFSTGYWRKGKWSVLNF